MGQSAKIRPEQIAQAKKLLQDLPEKEDRKTRSEAAKILPKELSQMLKNEGIIIPAYLIKQFFTENEPTPFTVKKEKAPMKMQSTEKSSFIIPDASDEEL